MAKGRRFDEYFWINKHRSLEPGPGFYKPKTELHDRVKAKRCVMIRKPEIVDEQFYEIIGGTSKVLQPHLLRQIERHAIDSAAKTFNLTRNHAYGKETIHPDKPSETFLH